MEKDSGQHAAKHAFAGSGGPDGSQAAMGPKLGDPGRCFDFQPSDSSIETGTQRLGDCNLKSCKCFSCSISPPPPPASASAASVTQHHQHNTINTTPSTKHHQHNIINTSSSTQHHQHNIINTTPSTQHHSHIINSTTSSTQHHQHNITNTLPSTHHHQHNTINKRSSTKHHQHNSIKTTPSTQHHLHYIIKHWQVQHLEHCQISPSASFLLKPLLFFFVPDCSLFCFVDLFHSWMSEDTVNMWGFLVL